MFRDKKVLLAYIAVCIIWGSTYLAIKIGVTNFPPLIFAGTRHIMAGFIMIGFSLYRGYKFPSSTIDILKISLVGFFLLSLANGAVVFAEQWVDSGFIALVVAINPIVILSIESLLMKRFVSTKTQTISMVLGFIGVAILVGGDLDLNKIPMIAIILSLTAPVFWAIGSIIGSVSKSDSNVYVISGIQMLAGGIGQFLIGALLGELYKIPALTSEAVLSWLYLVLIGSIIGYSSYQYTLKKLPATIASTATYINPAVAVLLGFVILREAITIITLLSSALIIASVVIANTTKKQINYCEMEN